VEDDVFQMVDYVGPILPISESEIVILSESFAGETVVYEPEKGVISHQPIVYRPAEVQPSERS